MKPMLCEFCAANKAPCLRASLVHAIGPCTQRIADWEAGQRAERDRAIELASAALAFADAKGAPLDPGPLEQRLRTAALAVLSNEHADRAERG